MVVHIQTSSACVHLLTCSVISYGLCVQARSFMVHRRASDRQYVAKRLRTGADQVLRPSTIHNRKRTSSVNRGPDKKQHPVA